MTAGRRGDDRGASSLGRGCSGGAGTSSGGATERGAEWPDGGSAGRSSGDSTGPREEILRPKIAAVAVTPEASSTPAAAKRNHRGQARLRPTGTERCICLHRRLDGAPIEELILRLRREVALEPRRQSQEARTRLACRQVVIQVRALAGIESAVHARDR